MAFRWLCDTCGQLHGSNPSKCRRCGATVFTPLSKARVAEHSSSPFDVEALDPDEIVTYGTTPDPEFASSPDVAPDGSIQRDEQAAEPSQNAASSRRGLCRRSVEFVAVLVLAAVLAGILLLL